jgi:hypothetical protein
LLAFAAKSAGFARVEILPLHPVIDPDVAAEARSEPGTPEMAITRAMDGPQDYALIARK